MMRLSLIVVASVLLAACENDAPEAPRVAEPPPAASEAAATDGPAAASGIEEPLALAASGQQMEWGPCPEGMPEGCGIAVLHGDPAKPNADIFLRVPGGSTIPPHTHTSAERMILVSGELEVKYQGADAATLRTGHYAYGPAKLPHRATCRSDEPCTLFIAFEQPVDVVPFSGSLD